jgi:hypothetical protein
MKRRSTNGDFTMKIATISILSMIFGFSAVGFKGDEKSVPGDTIPQQTSIKTPKFLKMQPKNCNISGISFEEAVKECLKKERAWLHL